MKNKNETLGWGQILTFVAILVFIGVSISNHDWNAMIWQIVSLIFFLLAMSHHKTALTLAQLADAQQDLINKLTQEKQAVYAQAKRPETPNK